MGVLNIPDGLAKQESDKLRTRDLHEADVGLAGAPFGVSGCRYSLAQGIPRIVAGTDLIR